MALQGVKTPERVVHPLSPQCQSNDKQRKRRLISRLAAFVVSYWEYMTTEMTTICPIFNTNRPVFDAGRLLIVPLSGLSQQ